MFRRLLLVLVSLCVLALPERAAAETLQDILQTHQAEVAKPGRRSVGVVLDDLVASGLPQALPFLEAWRDREIVQRDIDGLFFRAVDEGLLDLDTGAVLPVTDTSQVRPNGGVRRAIGDALVQFQLSDPNISKRLAAVEAIERSMDASQLAPLRASIDGETDPGLKVVKTRLAGMLAARFADDPAVRIDAIKALSGDLSVDVRATLNQILATTFVLERSADSDANIKDRYFGGTEAYPLAQAKPLLTEAGLFTPPTTASDLRNALTSRIEDGAVAGIPVAKLDTQETRRVAYDRLAAAGTVPPFSEPIETWDWDPSHISVGDYVVLEVYTEADPAITKAARTTLTAIEQKVAMSQAVDLGLDALSLASIYFLAAIGLAITFGVMGVINMAHGEFIMMGAYTGYVVQLFVPDYTLSILVALPLAFAITFGAGVAMERLVIRWLYHRPLETLLATFGISIALQQLAKNIFGTQARPLTSPAWLDGALVFNDVIAISYIRIAIFVLALLFLAVILFVLKRTRLGLEVRAVTQNPGMAASMGINPDRINMLTFGLGSGIAGIAGVAIGLYAKVTSEMGADYIVQSFMTVVVGGVGNVWGTLAGASLIGFLQKGIEWFNPSNTLAAQTYMILFIILFIQFRPKGIVALKGRAAAD